MANGGNNHKGGRPLKFKSVEELQAKIDAYFEKVEKNKDIPTVTALAYDLDIARQTFIEYKINKLFGGPINRAKQKIEIFWEKQLLTPKVTAGVSFNLKNNYSWKDKQEIHNTGAVHIHYDKDEAAMCGEGD